MTSSTNEPEDSRRDLADHEQPEVGLVADEDLPEDLQPSDDNPLAKDPDDSEEPQRPVGGGDLSPGADMAPGGGS